MRYLLALLIFVLTTIDVFGWTLSLAPGLSVKNAILYLIMLALAARIVVRGGIRLELPQVHLWFGVLIAYATLTWLGAGLLLRYESYTLVSSGIDLKAFLLDNAVVFVLYLYGTRTLADAKFLLKCVLLAVAAANAIAIGNVAGLFQIGTTTVGVEGNLAGRVFGAFGHANETAALIAFLLPAYVAASFSSAGLGRFFWALAGAISGALLIMSGSRGGFTSLAFAAVFGSYFCRNLISWRRAAILAAILVAVAVPVLAFVSVKFGDILTQRVTELIFSPGTSSDERVYIWRPIIDKMLSNPIALITGFGWDTYDVMGFTYAVHNHYLWLWFELGIIGLSSYLMLITRLLITARRAARIASDETAHYLVAFIYGIVAISWALLFAVLFRPWLYIWIWSAVAMRMAVITMQSALPHVHEDHRGASTLDPLPAGARRARARLPVTPRNR
jgi:O-antigen ligase